VTALLAALPILLVLVLMVGLGWPATRAGIAGASLALGIAIIGFGLGTDVLAEVGLTGSLLGVVAEAAFTSLTILWIILPALAIYHLQVATGGTDVLRVALGRLSGDPRVLALLIGWFFALFMEGGAGFGSSVALAAPFLVGVGYRPLAAVVIAMIGHMIGVSFGAIGTPVVPMVAATGIDALELSAATATYHLAFGWIPPIIVVLIASRAVGGKLTGAIWGWTALAAAGFLVPMWVIATFIGPELPTLGGSLIGMGVFVAALLLVARRRGDTPVADTPAGGASSGDVGRDDRARDHGSEAAGRRSEARSDAAPPGRGATEAVGPLAETSDDPVETAEAAMPRDVPTDARALLLAGSPYLILITLVVVTRLIPAVADPLGAPVWMWELEGGFTGSIAPLTHPGTLLVVSFLLGALVQRVSAETLKGALGTTFRQLVPVTIALLAMLLLARLMVRSGMTEALAEAAATSTASAWPVIAPFVGVLGTFVTGSATASNVLFTDLQVATAERLGYSTTTMLGAQNYGAAVGNPIAPHNIVAGGATVGLTGAEADVMRGTIVTVAGYALLGGLLGLLLV
jgi:lactate permease